MRGNNIIENIAHQLLMTKIQFISLGLLNMLGLQLQHHGFGHIALQILLDRGNAPFRPEDSGTLVKGLHIARRQPLVKHDVDSQLIEAMQQLAIKMTALRIGKSTTPIIRHQLIVVLYLDKLIHPHPTRMRKEIILQFVERLSDKTSTDTLNDRP